jgi:hypothetical protein
MSEPTFQYAVDVDVDLDKTACCSLKRIRSRRPFCDRPAEWVSMLGCCGHRKLVCERHRNVSLSVFPLMFLCTRCHAPYPPTVASWKV